MQANLTGTQLGGYVIGQHLADGGMGAVYQAYLPGTTIPYAIKIMLPDLVTDEEFRNRFKREAQILLKLKHPHIMPVYAAGEDQGMLYFVMPLVRGPSLYELLNRRRFSPATAWQILNPISEALDFAHSLGIVHRDIKPGNILVEPRQPIGNHVYLVDFGLSKGRGMKALTKAGISVGTPHYMAPEQVMARALTPQTDVYALGVVVYEMLLGRLPYLAHEPQEVALQHVHDTVPKPSALNPKFPRPLETVLLRVLAKDPQERYQTAYELKMAYANAVQALSPEERRMEFWGDS